MAVVTFNEEKAISINPATEEPIKTKVQDINYIPSYKQAELERQANEKEREAYYNDIQQRVANGEFNGKDGEKGEKGEKGDKGEDGTFTFEELTEEQKASLKGDKGDTGEKGQDGYTPVRGTDYWTEVDKNEMKSYIDSQLGVIENAYY